MSADTLAWIAYAGAAAAVVVYFWAWIRRPAWLRLLNNAGLFFTGLGLLFVPMFAPEGEAADRYAAFAVAFLVLAVLAQSVAAFRERRAWDGYDRRSERPQPWRGEDRRVWHGQDRRRTDSPPPEQTHDA
jgi:hypothetical protein